MLMCVSFCFAFSLTLSPATRRPPFLSRALGRSSEVVAVIESMRVEALAADNETLSARLAQVTDENEALRGRLSDALASGVEAGEA